MSWHEIPAGLELGTPGDYVGLYHEQRYQDGPFTLPCPGNPAVPLAGAHGLAVSDSYAADNVSAFAAYDLVQIYTSGAWHGGGVAPGWASCESLAAGTPASNARYLDATVAIDGIATELRSVVDGTLRPILSTVAPHFPPETDGLFMRPTALAWAGQDPNDAANRSVWLPSEVIGVIGAVHIQQFMVETSAWDVTLGCGVRALNVISGGPSISVEGPVICFV